MNENKEYITKEEAKGTINISADVIAAVAAAAAADVEGVAGISGSGKDIVDFLSSKKNLVKGVKITSDESVLTVDVSVVLNIGAEIESVAKKVQAAVMESVEATTGLKVGTVNVHVNGLALN